MDFKESGQEKNRCAEAKFFIFPLSHRVAVPVRERVWHLGASRRERDGPPDAQSAPVLSRIGIVSDRYRSPRRVASRHSSLRRGEASDAIRRRDRSSNARSPNKRTVRVSPLKHRSLIANAIFSHCHRALALGPMMARSIVALPLLESRLVGRPSPRRAVR